MGDFFEKFRDMFKKKDNNGEQDPEALRRGIRILVLAFAAYSIISGLWGILTQG